MHNKRASSEKYKMPLEEKRGFFANKNINRIASGFRKYSMIKVSCKTKRFPFAEETVTLYGDLENRFTSKRNKWYIS